MEYREFGRTGLAVSALAMGCSRLGAFWQGRSIREGKDATAAALDGGVTFFDTADMYGRGISERILGAALRRRRDEVVIVTKCGLVKTPAALLRARGHKAPVRRLPTRILEAARTRRCYSEEYVVRSAEASLRRLRTDRIDVLMLHSPPIQELDLGATVSALGRLQTAGKIRAWGVSARTDHEARLALDLPGIGCIQTGLSLCEDHAPPVAIREAFARGVAVVARQPLASTLGQPSDDSVRRVCIQLALQAEGVSTVLVGMSRPRHVIENLASASADIADAEEIERVRSILCAERHEAP